MIIGILGSIGSGKNTVASYIHNQYNFQHHSYASNLKDICALLFHWDRELLEGASLLSRKWREEPDEWWANALGIPNFSPRLALQLMGTDVMRNHFHQDIWVLSLQRRLLGDHNAVISDARFPNEVATIKQLGGLIIRVDRGKKPEWWTTAMDAMDGCLKAEERMLTMYKDVHQSEWAWVNTDPDEIIYNNTTLADLYSAIDAVAIKHGF